MTLRRVPPLLSALLLVGSLALTGTASAAPDDLGPGRAEITCDASTGKISTRLTGKWVPGFAYQAEFRLLTGSFVRTDGSLGRVPQFPAVTGTGTGASNGALNIDGYTRDWNASDYLFYTETVRVIVRNSAGAQVAQKDATCYRDVYTTYTITCDRSAHTVSATVSGTRYRPNGQVVIEYNRVTTSQRAPGEFRWTSMNLGPTPEISHREPTDANGSWSDLGYSHTFTTDPYYYSQTVHVIVKHTDGTVIGRGSDHCVYADGT
ncbi:hypothetical protein E1287_20675 [Actinomadura sp. KC06]|uniref:hypothetical protein n=1 Tax=Actinomadura sp. KC06 TaxID=2530369 RepID=UPI001052E448|nr:hypothetical protein [Actinomadura sp. KC06]TDD33005.1 hypothetical protein E1287_20675 [Actinomadura sp. KC06]